MRLPSDLEILRHIYETYVEDFQNFAKTEGNRSARYYVPIDISRVASCLETDPYILHGRLRFHLGHKYGYIQDDGSHVSLFADQVGSDRHCIHFPYLASIVSEKTVEDTKNNVALVLSLLSLGIAIASLVIKVNR